MALPSAGYDLATVTNPGNALTDFTLIVDLSRMSASWWSDAENVSTGYGRAAIHGSATEVATDWIDYNHGANTGWLRVIWTGTLAASGTQQLRVYPPKNDGRTLYAASDTYGSDNAYDLNWLGNWPDGGGTDRTSAGNDGTAEGGVIIGGATGKTGVATNFDGNDDGINLGAKVVPSGAKSIFVWFKMPAVGSGAGTTFDYVLMSRTDGGTSFDDYLFYFNDGTTLRFLPVGSGGSALDYAAAIDDNAWKHVVYTRSGTAQSMYINASSVASDSGAADLSADGVNDVIGGTSADASSRSWYGDICEVSVHSIDRGVDWISQEYSQTNDNATFWGTWTWQAVSSSVIPLISHHRQLMFV